jgi:hypothetical protein
MENKIKTKEIPEDPKKKSKHKNINNEEKIIKFIFALKKWENRKLRKIK